MEELSKEEKLEKGYLLCNVIIQIVGSPKDHIEKAIKLLIESIKKQKHHEVVSSNIFEAEETNDENIFSTFAEIEMLFKDCLSLFVFCMEYVPSSVEVLKPDRVSFDSGDFTGIVSDLLALIHEHGMILKNLKAENTFIKQNMSRLVNNGIRISLKSGPLKLAELSKLTGVKEEELELFLKTLVEKKEVINQEGLFALVKK